LWQWTENTALSELGTRSRTARVEDVEWSAMDATRTPIDYLCRCVEAAIRVGATTRGRDEGVDAAATGELHRLAGPGDVGGNRTGEAGAVAQARDLVEDVEWSAMDATRTPIDYLCRCVEAAIRVRSSG
jgi:isopropylmalate/homocitrate/citramalate synthase